MLAKLPADFREEQLHVRLVMRDALSQSFVEDHIPFAGSAKDPRSQLFIVANDLVSIGKQSCLSPIKDKADVIELIRVNRIPADFATGLNPYVRDTFRAMWQAAQVDEEF